ncbi:FxSxx-COOH system tetratricopeptide repeat protein [Streptomyces sp. NPDC005322]|uniref:FxSxx-COOH system tetratricopeptide repeat protein n=1 Tax=unclassified Streptomyces TaxID=2593676 RepID=UPI0033B05F6D
MEDEVLGGELVPQPEPGPLESGRVGDLKPVPEHVKPPCRELALGLRGLFGAVRVSLRVFALRMHYDPATVSRYLNGTVVAPAHFVDQLLAAAARATGRPSSAEVVAHVHALQRAALQATNRAGWELQKLRDQLADADRERQQAEVRAEALTEALQARKQRIAEMEVEQRRIAVAVSAERDDHRAEAERLKGEQEDLRTERDRLREEVARLQYELGQAKRQALEAEERCEALEHQLQAGEDAVGATAEAEAEDPVSHRLWLAEEQATAAEERARRLERELAELRSRRPGPPITVVYEAAGRSWAEWIARRLAAAGAGELRFERWNPSGRLPWPSGVDGCLVLLLSGNLMGRGLQAVRELVESGPPAERIAIFPIGDRAMPGSLETREVDEEAVGRLLREVGLSSAPSSHATPERVPDIWDGVPRRNPRFTGRDDLLQQLHTRLRAAPAEAAVCTLVGTPGIGKTQLAVEYAYRYASEYRVVWWVAGDGRAALRERLAALAPALGLDVGPEIGDRIRAVLDALRRGHLYDGWLLVLDGAEIPDDVAGLLPSGRGHTLLTSRNHAWRDHYAELLEVPPLTREEGVALVRRRAPRIEAEEAERLVAAVEGLPLALDQTAGWLDGSTMSVAEYVRMVREGEPIPVRAGADYPLPYPEAFKAFVEWLRQHAKAGAELLRLCARFGPGPVPLALLRAVPADLVSPAVAALLESPSQWELAMGGLVHASAVRVEADALHMHRFVRDAVRRRTSDDMRDKDAHLVRSALAATDPGSPEDPSTWPRYAELMPYVESSGALADGPARQLSLKCLTYLRLSGAHEAARRLAEPVLDVQDRAAAPDWELTLGCTAVLRATGDYTRAERLDRAVLGQLHIPDSIDAMSALAADLRGLGLYQEPYELSRRQLDACLPFEGDEDYLRAHSDVAASLRTLGSYAQALEYDEKAVRQRRTAPGLSTLASGTNYAWDLRLAGHYAKALDHQARNVEVHRDHVGPQAPHRLTAEHLLALCQVSCGQTTSGATLLGETLRRAEGLFGRDAPLSLMIASGYVCALWRDGRLEESHALSRFVAETYRTRLGGRHPYTIGAQANRGLTLLRSGEADRSRTVLETALAEMTAVLGEDHPWTLGIALNTAASCYATRSWTDACALSRETALRAREVLGERHPLTLLAQVGLAADLRELPGGRDEARAIRQVAIGGLEATLGPGHPQVLAAWQRVRLVWDFEPLPV